ncbi:hypothetical protein D3C79_860850 [compost metagenome]
MTDDGFIEGGAIEQQQRRLLLDIHHQFAAAAIHDCQLGGADRVAVAEANGAFEHKQGGGVSLW